MISLSYLPGCFVFHKDANSLRKLTLDSKIKAEFRKEPPLRQDLRYEKTNKYDNDKIIIYFYLPVSIYDSNRIKFSLSSKFRQFS